MMMMMMMMMMMISDDSDLGVPCSHLLLETEYAKCSPFQAFHPVLEDIFLYST